MSNPVITDERSKLGEITALLHSLRHASEGYVIVAFGAHGPSTDCRNGHVSATLQREGEQATGEALHLQDAILIARAQVDRQIEARNKAREEAKAKSDA